MSTIDSDRPSAVLLEQVKGSHLQNYIHHMDNDDAEIQDMRFGAQQQALTQTIAELMQLLNIADPEKKAAVMENLSPIARTTVMKCASTISGSSTKTFDTSEDEYTVPFDLSSYYRQLNQQEREEYKQTVTKYSLVDTDLVTVPLVSDNFMFFMKRYSAALRDHGLSHVIPKFGHDLPSLEPVDSYYLTDIFIKYVAIDSMPTWFTKLDDVNDTTIAIQQALLYASPMHFLFELISVIYANRPMTNEDLIPFITFLCNFYEKQQERVDYYRDEIIAFIKMCLPEDFGKYRSTDYSSVLEFLIDLKDTGRYHKDDAFQEPPKTTFCHQCYTTTHDAFSHKPQTNSKPVYRGNGNSSHKNSRNKNTPHSNSKTNSQLKRKFKNKDAK